MTFFTQQDRANLISKIILTLIFLIALTVSAFAQSALSSATVETRTLDPQKGTTTDSIDKEFLNLRSQQDYLISILTHATILQ